MAVFGRKRVSAWLSVLALVAGLNIATLPAQAVPAAGAFTFLNQTLSSFPCGGSVGVPYPHLRVNPQTVWDVPWWCGPVTWTGKYRGRTPDGSTFESATLTLNFFYAEICRLGGPQLPPEEEASGRILVNGAPHGFAAFDWWRIGTEVVITVGTTGSGGVGVATFHAATGFGTCEVPAPSTVDVIGAIAGI